MYVVEVKEECSVVYGDGKQLPRMFFLFMFLAFQTKVKHLEVKYCYFAFKLIVAGTRGV